jgi:hypothetical protein
MMSRVRAASIRAPSCAPATVRSESEFARAIDQLHTGNVSTMIESGTRT